MITATIILAATIAAQPQAPRDNEPVPVALALQDLSDAYSAAPTADEISARVIYRGADSNEALTQSLTVRIDPDPDNDSLRRVLLELGPLRAYFADGQMLITSAAAPDKYYESSYRPPLTSATIQSLLPPVPAPQLALAAGINANQTPDLTPYTPDVSFTSAIASTRTRPPVVLISGSSPAGPVTLITDVQTGRLTRFTADLASPHPTSIELTIRPSEPGDPQEWKPDIAERRRVRDLTELTPSPPTPLQVGDRAPDLSLSHPEQRIWSLPDSLAANPGKPLALILWRWTPEPERTQAAMRSAQTAGGVMLQLRKDFPDMVGPHTSAVVLELGDYTGALLADLHRQWRENPQGPSDLYWSPSAARSIDRFTPEADAALIIIGADRRIRSIIPLDNTSEQDLFLNIRSLLTPLDGP